MKKILSVFITVFITVNLFGQTFEGKITYRNSFKSKLPEVKDEQFNSMMGTRMEYFIKGGDYKSVTDGTFSQWQLYNRAENKLYSKMSNSETVLWNDGSVNDDSIIDSKINKGAMEILGYTCDELILTCKTGAQKYYFNSKLGVDAKLFANHKYGNWYDFLKRANAVPLKMIIENQQFAMESVAIEVIPMKLDDKEFQLPANTKTEKNPY